MDKANGKFGFLYVNGDGNIEGEMGFSSLDDAKKGAEAYDDDHWGNSLFENDLYLVEIKKKAVQKISFEDV